MARVEIPFTVDKTVTISGTAASQPVSGASVQVNIHGGGAAQVYAAETGGSPISNPLTTDASGRIEGWVEEDVRYDLAVSGTGITNYTQTWTAPRVGAVGTSQLGTGAVTNDRLASNAVTAAKVLDGEITLSKLAAAVANALVPAGSIVATARTSAPTGFLLCDGAAVSRTTYSDLFAAIGTTYGAGNGSTTFNVPDLRGRSIFGPSSGTGRIGSNGSLGNSSGADTHVLVTGQLPSHSHGVNDPGHSHNFSGAVVITKGAGFDFNEPNVAGNRAALTATGAANSGISIQSAGSDQAHNNMPPYAVCNWTIKT